MKLLSITFFLLIGSLSLFAQEEENPKFYLGLSYGTSYALGDFRDTDISNPDAGFAKNGSKIDVFGGFFLREKVTLVGTFRYQRFETEIEDLIEDFNEENPGADFTGSTEDWQAYYVLVGVAYQVNITKKIDFFPRFALGPLVANNPGITVNAPNAVINNNFSRTSETGFGLGYEIGIGLRTDFGKRFSLLPTFTFSSGFVTIPDVVTTTDNVIVIADYQPQIHAFNLGLSLGYRFY